MFNKLSSQILVLIIIFRKRSGRRKEIEKRAPHFKPLMSLHVDVPSDITDPIEMHRMNYHTQGINSLLNLNQYVFNTFLQIVGCDLNEYKLGSIRLIESIVMRAECHACLGNSGLCSVHAIFAG